MNNEWNGNKDKRDKKIGKEIVSARSCSVQMRSICLLRRSICLLRRSICLSLKSAPKVATRVLLASLLLIFLAGCSKRVYVPVESVTVRTDTVRHTQRIIERDTVTRIERITESRLDSIAPILDSIGRLVGYDRWHIIDRSASLQERNDRLSAIVDSLRELKADSVVVREPYPVEVVREVNRLYWWQKTLMGVGIVALIGIAVGVRWLLRRRK